MYSSTRAKVKLQQGTTSTFNPNIGIRQGDCLSPLLFNQFIADLSRELNKNNIDPIQVGETDISHLLFADDLLLVSKSSEGLQGALSTLHTYCENWKLSVNLKKIKSLSLKSIQGNRGTQISCLGMLKLTLATLTHIWE